MLRLKSDESVYKCAHCDKVCKFQGGLTLHRRKKHPEVNKINKPDYDEISREKPPPPLLQNMIHEILSELSKDDWIVPKSKYRMIMSYTKNTLNAWHIN